MKNIMLVGNDRIILRFMTKLLEKEGYQVVTAADGLNALDVLKNYTPDVIFVDLIMPNIDGEALCRLIRDMPKLKDVYLIILSAITVEERTDISQFGANVIIAKGPFNEMAQHVICVLNQPDLASSRCLSGDVFGIKSVYPRGITKELMSIKKHFEIILERMSEGILEINSEGRIVYVNPAALLLINKLEKELLGSSFVDLFSGDDRRRVGSLMKIKSNKPKTITEDAPVRLNGHQVTLNILSLDENESKFIAILSDVSERKPAEEALRKAHNELEERVEERTAELTTANEQLNREIDERIQAEESLKLSNEELLKESNQRKFLSKRLIDLLEKDRKEIAMELHDHIGQILTALKMNLEMIGSRLKHSDHELASQIKAAEQKAIDALTDINHISHGLKPGMLDTLGLKPSLGDLFDGIQEQTDIKINFFSRNVPKRFAQEKELAVYRIAQEALTNIIKHAKAKNVFVNLSKMGDVLFLSVEDDGIGFESGQVMGSISKKKHLGLVIMKERAVQFGGEFSIESRKPGGTHLSVEIAI